MTTLHDYLRQLGDLIARTNAMNGAAADGWTHGSVEHLLLDRGRAFPVGGDLAAWRPRAPAPGPAKACFRNAFELARTHRGDLAYCEGYATSYYPTLHAWTVEVATGLVVDPTWEFGYEYVGVAFDFAFVDRWVLATERWGVFGGEHRDVLDLLRDGLPANATVDVPTPAPAT